jgi:hypothetical protein
MPRLPLLLGYGIEFSERLLYRRFRPAQVLLHPRRDFDSDVGIVRR